MNSSMNVPEVVKTAMRMKADHGDRRAGDPVPARDPQDRGCSEGLSGPVTPNAPRAMWKMPRGSSNQFGPSMPTQLSTLFTGPVALNRKSHSTTMATER